ncbi:MAG: class I SAM-dependent methyltransferase [Saprospiraceae bacterium]|nr:class I SAM-dependent methyltransferase [Saprospiraceae bacterium]
MENRYQETFDTWNKVAELYEAKFFDLTLYDETYDFICNSLLMESPKLLDVGCGPGNISKYLHEKRPDFQIHGVDVSRNMIQLAQKNNPTCSFEVMDIRNLNRLSLCYDGIICGFCLPYLSEADVHNFIDAAYKLLNEEGLLYLSFVKGNPKDSGFIVGSSGDRSYFYYHSPKVLEEKLIASSFQLKKRYEVVYKKSESEKEMHTILIAQKKR